MKRNGLKNFSLLLMLILLVSAFSGCGSSDSAESTEEYKFFRLGTASMGGNFFPIGSALAQLANEKVEGVHASAQATGGSAENATFLHQGELELGLIQSAALKDAFTGQGKFEGRKLENLRGVTAIYFMEFHILVRKDAGIEKIEDMKGKKIAVGPKGIFGQILGVSATYIYMFILFGAFLAATGMSDFFNEMALSIAGHAKGGAAKVAVLSSGFMGSISGNTSANVVTTGIVKVERRKLWIMIPVKKKFNAYL